MGFWRNIANAANPVKHIKEGVKDPWGSIKNNVARGLDPAGSFVREGRGMEAMPTNIKDAYDPGGFIAEGAQAPNSYDPNAAGHMNLSPGAQAMYDQMRARSAARAS